MTKILIETSEGGGIEGAAVKPIENAVILDASPLWLGAIEDVLSKNGVEVVGSAREAERALELVDRHKPGLLVADPVAGGVECVREARSRVPDLTAVAVGSLEEPGQVLAAFGAGAIAFVVKTERFDSVEAALPEALSPSPLETTRPAAA
ncbi:MAG: response regulator transcription factor [Actinobacteria bacterium]|nr:MAG: response regulator transcription factor [Actinomycetota bacterium]